MQLLLSVSVLYTPCLYNEAVVKAFSEPVDKYSDDLPIEVFHGSSKN